MSWIVQNLWLIPALPMFAAGIIALLKRPQRVPAAALAIGSMAASLILSLTAFFHTLHHIGTIETARETFNFAWFQFGDQWFRIGWVLDPLTAVMLAMVTFVGLLIFIYSIGYMEHDENFTRFFCFLALFAGAMLGVVIANNLLLLFMCWEIVGLTSYLLIGFWFHKPSAAAAAKKAFLVTRIGDVVFFLGIMYLYAQSGTLLFYDGGHGALETSALTAMVAHSTVFGLAASTAISLLIFCGAAGKSGQVPLHVWLPDAMEGPTPVSALIHAATMVAAGVFLMARIYPLLAAAPFGCFSHNVGTFAFVFPNAALQIMTWVGAITAIYAAVIAVAQWDIKRILAYSTVSQLGYMMMGLGVGGPAVGMFHLITHAFFKALLFMGAGSVIHGCSGEQHIARMGGLRRFMPITFATYAVGMLALSGFPIFFSGFWSKDAILHSAHEWSLSQVPFLLGSIGALLTAFYMTRQIYYVFAGELRLRNPEKEAHPEQDVPHDGHAQHGHAHESPSVMTTPLVVLAACTLVLGYFGTPAWPWFQAFLNGEHANFSFEGFHEPGLLTVMFASSVIALTGLFLGWLLYGRKPLGDADPLEQAQPGLFAFVHNAFHVDAFYSATIVRLNTLLSRVSDLFDRYVFNGIVQLVSWTVLGIAHFDRLFDAAIVNPGFDAGTGVVSLSGRMLSLFQTGRAQTYLRFIGVALIALLALLLWGAR